MSRSPRQSPNSDAAFVTVTVGLCRFCAAVAVIIGIVLIQQAWARRAETAAVKQTALDYLRVVVHGQMPQVALKSGQYPKIVILRTQSEGEHARAMALIKSGTDSIETDLVLVKSDRQRWKVIGVQNAQMTSRQPQIDNNLGRDSEHWEVLTTEQNPPEKTVEAALRTAFADRPGITINRY